MVKYGFPGCLVRGNSKNYRLQATDSPKDVKFDNVSKGLTIRNVGPNTAYISFDDDPVDTNALPIPANEKERWIHLQVAKVNAVCATAETADLRILCEV